MSRIDFKIHQRICKNCGKNKTCEVRVYIGELIRCPLKEVIRNGKNRQTKNESGK